MMAPNNGSDGDPALAALPPGRAIGILGSGQLARMLVLAAARLGFACHIYADAAGPAFDVAARTTTAPYDDEAALTAFAADVAAATYEFENIPVATVEHLARRIPVRPGARALAITQDRVAEKTLARSLAVPTAVFDVIDGPGDIVAALARDGRSCPAILKTRRFGYDGKGQVRVRTASEADAAWAAIGRQPAILESVVPFTREISVIGVRGVGGEFRAYDPIENVHRDHILHTSTVPAAITPETAATAIEIARRIGEALEYVGTFAVEMFEVGGPASGAGPARPDGDGAALFLNEIAPRVHNSGHLTLDACPVSQFENHIRAIAGWPLGAAARHSNAVMTNLIGSDVETWRELALAPPTGGPSPCIHIYGKREARAGRKMGHVTRLLPRV